MCYNVEMEDFVNSMHKTTRAVLGFVIKYKAEHDGNSPVVRQFKTADGELIPLSTVYHHLNKLEDAGIIRRGDYADSRSIEIVGATWRPPGWLSED